MTENNETAEVRDLGDLTLDELDSVTPSEVEAYLLAASSLDNLAERLNVCASGGLAVDHVSASLPTLGGDEPRDTTGVYSWDETRLLTFNSNGRWRVEPRACHTPCELDSQAGASR